MQNVLLIFEDVLFTSFKVFDFAISKFDFNIVSLILSSSIKNVCQMLMTLGVGSRDVYKEDFEKPFLDQSADFYRVSPFDYFFLSFFRFHVFFRVTFNSFFQMIFIRFQLQFYFEIGDNETIICIKISSLFIISQSYDL